MSDKDINLGSQNKNQIYQNFVDTIFTLPKNQYSKPIKGPFGWHIFKVTKITAGKKVNLISVKEKIKNKLKTEKSCEIASNIINNAEDDIASGQNISQISKKYSLKINNNLIKNDNTEYYLNFLSIKENQTLKNEVFKETEINIPYSKYFTDNKSIIYQIETITPSRYYAIDEIKGILIAKVKQHKLKKQYNDTASNISKTLSNSSNKKQTLRKLQKTHKFKIHNISLTRNEQNYPEIFINQIFNLELKQNTPPSYIAQENHYIIGLYNNNKIKKTSPGQKLFLNEKLKNIYQKQITDAIYDNYSNYLVKKYQVEIRQDK